MDNPYSYKMPYVPYANQIIDLSLLNSKQSREVSATSKSAASTGVPVNITANDLNAVSIDAINSMLSMCSMVYMMCIQKLGGGETEHLTNMSDLLSE